MSTLDLVAQAERRARIAAMLGRLPLQEPGPDADDLVADLPELEPLGRTDPELAVTYEGLFLREIPLFESVFVGGDGQRGNLIDELGVDLDLNLDHAPSVDAAFDAAFELVHIDVSPADHYATDETIVAATGQVVEHARTSGALVEGELRYLRGSSTDHQLPPDTEANAFAIAIEHRLFPTPWKNRQPLVAPSS